MMKAESIYLSDWSDLVKVWFANKLRQIVNAADMSVALVNGRDSTSRDYVWPQTIFVHLYLLKVNVKLISTATRLSDRPRLPKNNETVDTSSLHFVSGKERQLKILLDFVLFTIVCSTAMSFIMLAHYKIIPL